MLLRYPGWGFVLPIRHRFAMPRKLLERYLHTIKKEVNEEWIF